MEIQNSHIKEAEAILIDGNTFDELERVPFIKNLETRDLLAVPGSGKTTALQAKLYCLAKQMPFDDRSGILVLSHTNKAVEEIEKKLKEHCPQLFQHPNFIGTVQSFVDTFLALPFYTNHTKSKVHSISEEFYLFSISNYLKFQFDTPVAYAKNNNPKLFSTARIWFNNENEKILSDGLTNKILSFNPPQKWIREGNSDRYIAKIMEVICRMKQTVMAKGALHYDDCYYLARCYINNFVSINKILQARFKYVFIDEAQDLEKYQLDIIESIFNTEESNCVIQRIGDINQSIYNSGKSIKVECDWEPRNPMPLNSSMRLTKEVADIVDCFTLKKDFSQINGEPLCFKVEGKRTIEGTIPPYLIIFNHDTTRELKPKFEELIRQHSLFDGLDGINTKKGYKVIGWSGTWKEEDSKGRLRLENIFPNEYIVASESKKSKVNLCEYLICNPQNKTLKKYSDNIIDALCATMRIAECMNKTTRNGKEHQRHYTSQTLWKYLVEESRKSEGKLSEQDLLDFKSRIYTWSFSIATNNKIENTYNEIKSFVVEVLSKWLEFSIGTEISAFLGDNYKNVVLSETESVVSSDIPIEICSVHSVKGQTHCATMYVETSYYNYETEKKQVINALKKEQHSLLTSKNAKHSIQAYKMMYVGFSRPTHLLCFAVFKNNISDEDITKMVELGWIKIDLT